MQLAKQQQRPVVVSKSSSSSAIPRAVSRRVVVCKAQQAPAASDVAKRAGAAAAAALLALSPLAPAALANEFDVLGEPTPTNYFFDDAGVLSKSTRSQLNKKLSLLETQTGYRVEVVTVRKLEFETDAYAFADKALDNWYPGAAADKKGVVLMVTASKEGAVTGGKAFLEAVGDELLDSVASDNIPIFAEEEKFNAAITTAVDRLEAKLQGNAVPEAPKRNDAVRQRTYKTKEETEKSKTVTSTVVLTLLLIACVVPMLQYYGYTARD